MEKASRYGPVIVESEVVVGKVAVINKKNHPMQKNWAAHGYDSAWIPPQCGVGSTGLEEHCIFDRTRVAPVKLYSSVQRKPQTVDC
jgi:hypothetical protein